MQIWQSGSKISHAVFDVMTADRTQLKKGGQNVIRENELGLVIDVAARFMNSGASCFKSIIKIRTWTYPYGREIHDIERFKFYRVYKAVDKIEDRRNSDGSNVFEQIGLKEFEK